LKLHIESIEYRLDELEHENEKLINEAAKFEDVKLDIEMQYMDQ
jgi:hypothetical protein